MGYRTHFELQIAKIRYGMGGKYLSYLDEDSNPILEDLYATLPVAHQALVEKNCYGERWSVQWYNHDDHMKEFSKKYPDLVFVLFGKGEGREDEYGEMHMDDVWITYYKDGKMQHSSLDQFHEGELK